jgi:CobQ-like glutamine amidotransferase family enzyme
VRLIGNIVVEVGAMSTDGRSDAASRRSIAASGRSIAASGRSIAASLLQPATRLVGFENHSGRTYLGAGVRPLGRVLAGNGNNGEDGSEGAVFHNAIGCYMHGSLLPKNPQLADLLISRALQRRYGAIAPLAPLDDTLELAAQRVMVERVVSSAGG